MNLKINYFEVPKFSLAKDIILHLPKGLQVTAAGKAFTLADDLKVMADDHEEG